ncbi:CHAT domain-containing protein, partial [Scytonema sp. NUACC26]|uniref:CHAT domain-containing protein n=1 Tax=Scytonema sp. NUACC26 TaxID=3140176 RepID=UPI0038B3B4B5
WAMTQNNLANAYCNRIKGERADNLERAIAFYTTVLEVYTRDAFPEDWAATQHNLATAYSDRIKGERADNLERAIAFYTAAVEVYTRDAFPEQWAMTQNNLALAYWKRIKGERADNLERAIAFYTAAVEVFTRNAFPEDWAATQHNLANAYLYRIKGERADNLERAIVFYTAALEVRTRDAFPEDWAMTQNNLANAYLYRTKGERADNLEHAIAFYTAAVEVRTRDAFPEQWAGIQHNLANTYSHQIKGERADNLERAIAFYTAAVEVYTRDVFLEQWAMTQNNLANAYSYRIKGERADNLERAIAFYTAVLEVYTRDAFPVDWAMTQNNLASAYSYRIKEERADNLEGAIAFYTAALEVRTRDAFPVDWAMTQNNLANAYSDRIRGEWADNLEGAIAFYTAALKVFTRDAFPEQWAMTQNNLANAYRDLEQFDEAIQCFKLALEIFTPNAFPINCLQSGRNLGNTAFDIQQWSVAIEGYDAAIQAVEQSCEWASSQTTRQELREAAIDVYTQIVKACIANNQVDKGIEYVERSKVRTLVELLANRNDFLPKGDIPQTVLEQLQDLKQQIGVKRQLLEVSENSGGVKQLQQELNELQSQLELVLNQIKPIDPSYQFTQKVQPISFEEIRKAIDDRTAIIAWFLISDRFFTFVITHENAPYFWESSSDDLTALEQWWDEYLNDYETFKDNKTIEWKTQFASRLQELSVILHLDNILSHIPSACQQLILIPHRYLHLLPLHALPLQSQEYLLDKFPDGVRYAPSNQLLQLSQRVASQQTSSSLGDFFALQNPTNDLEFTDLEVEAIQHNFDRKQILSKEKATKKALEQPPFSNAFLHAECVHFACHGFFHAPNPLLSHLLLAESLVASDSSIKTTTEATRYLPWRDSQYADLEKCLTLREIFALNLKQCRLVTLAACETGLTDWSKLTDEYIGLASSFLVAGSPTIVSSLWVVNDLSTCFLMIRFYQILQAEPSIAKALNNAQCWLRDVTKEELQQWIEKLSLSPGKLLWLQSKLQSWLSQANNKPFQSPEHWAAFCTIGH